MNVSRIRRRLVVSGVATAIAAAGLVGTSRTAATAAPVTGGADYNCATDLGTVSIPMTVGGILPDSVPAGWPIAPVDTLPVTGAATLPKEMLGLLGSALHVTEIGGSMPDFAMTLGSTSVPIKNLAAPVTPIVQGEDLALQATGVVGAFTTPAAGTYDLKLPQSFTMAPDAGVGGPTLRAFTCTIADGQDPVVGSLNVVKNDSATAVKAPAKVRKGVAAKLIATVTGGFNSATGKVAFFDGAKKLGTSSVKSGKATFAAKGLKVGQHTITAKYAGDGFRKASKSKAVTVKVVR